MTTRKRNKILLIDMTKSGIINGVTRCVKTLAENLALENEYDVIWVRYIHNTTYNVKKRIINGFTLIIIPLPNDMTTFLRTESVRSLFWKESQKYLEPYLDKNTIIHIHTLNLIELALQVKERFGCKVITHLHCLPWKGLYNTNIKEFNKLYDQYYNKNSVLNPSLFVRHKYELLSYTKSDCLVCVTQCARKFVSTICPNHCDIRVITNGIQDNTTTRQRNGGGNVIKCVFIGNSQKSKGLSFVLTAMQGVMIQLPTSLTIVGAIPKDTITEIMNQYPFLDLHFTGQISSEQLQQLYNNSDIGLIASLQEQCSYVAIEMMRSGLPVITTNVDGLDEMFIDDYNGIKIPVTYSSKRGLSVNTLAMTNAILRLGRDKCLRTQMSTNAYTHYLNNYSLEKMIPHIKDLYTSLSL